MAALPTVYINRDGVKVRINESKYDPAVHTLWGEEKPQPKQYQPQRSKRRAKSDDE